MAQGRERSEAVLPVPFLKILAYEETPLGVLCLRQRRRPESPETWVTEITLNHEFLMSSLHTASEQALARLALERLRVANPRVLIGGLGLGYTAEAALASPAVGSVVVIEYLPQVIGWLQAGQIPLSTTLLAEPRLVVELGDIYGYLLDDRVARQFDAILIDVDHSPDDPLDSDSGRFYTAAGLAAAARHLTPGGVLALWSYAEHTPTWESLQAVFDQVAAVPITYFNQHVQASYTDWLYLATARGSCGGS